ncbi:MAG: DUF6491 family protein [Gammaproteobacteria bacterium]
MNRAASFAAALLMSIVSLPLIAEEPSAEDILSGAAPAGEYVTKAKCVVSTRINRSEVLSDRFVVLHVARKELWLVRLRQRCSGLRPGSKVVYIKQNPDRICDMDALRTITGEESVTPQLGPICPLPEFEAVTKEQVEQLRKEIASARYRPPKPTKQ